jgi:hypothetical protein
MWVNIEMMEAVTFRSYTNGYSLLVTERLSANIHVTFHEKLIMSVLTLSTPSENLWQTPTLWRLMSLQNKVCCTNDNYARRAAFRDVHAAFRIPCVHAFIVKLRRSYRAMTITIIATFVKTMSSTGNIRGCNLTENILMTATLTQPPL